MMFRRGGRRRNERGSLRLIEPVTRHTESGPERQLVTFWPARHGSVRCLARPPSRLLWPVRRPPTEGSGPGPGGDQAGSVGHDVFVSVLVDVLVLVLPPLVVVDVVVVLVVSVVQPP